MDNRIDNNFYLTFYAKDDLMAVKVQTVVEVLEQQPITKIPKSPAHIMGVISFRGEIIPVIDPRVIIGLPSPPLTEFIIIVHTVKNERYNETLTVGVIAYSVNNVIEIKPLDILPATEFNTIIPAEYTFGVYQDVGRFITILNTDKILAISNNKSHDDNQN
ncbi:MAG: chemotaxis protein CheW [Bacteroidales bacterium]|nr:chemotaxis protein CheW [Bacteroidales bacterium]